MEEGPSNAPETAEEACRGPRTYFSLHENDPNRPPVHEKPLRSVTLVRHRPCQLAYSLHIQLSELRQGFSLGLLPEEVLKRIVQLVLLSYDCGVLCIVFRNWTEVLPQTCHAMACMTALFTYTIFQLCQYDNTDQVKDMWRMARNANGFILNTLWDICMICELWAEAEDKKFFKNFTLESRISPHLCANLEEMQKAFAEMWPFARSCKLASQVWSETLYNLTELCIRHYPSSHKRVEHFNASGAPNLVKLKVSAEFLSIIITGLDRLREFYAIACPSLKKVIGLPTSGVRKLVFKNTPMNILCDSFRAPKVQKLVGPSIYATPKHLKKGELAERFPELVTVKFIPQQPPGDVPLYGALYLRIIVGITLYQWICYCEAKFPWNKVEPRPMEMVCFYDNGLLSAYNLDSLCGGAVAAQHVGCYVLPDIGNEDVQVVGWNAEVIVVQKSNGGCISGASGEIKKIVLHGEQLPAFRESVEKTCKFSPRVDTIIVHVHGASSAKFQEELEVWNKHKKRVWVFRRQ